MSLEKAGHRRNDVAIIGMAGRFPGADDVEEFWANLANGVESIRRFTEEELRASGVVPETIADPSYVPARPILEKTRGFDAALFGYSPREATVADPQQRIFLECAWTALEQAGYPVPEGRGRVGVFAGANFSSYLQRRFDQFQEDLDASIYEVVMGNDKDALATIVSYRLDLTGPSVSVQTFCSTALVGVHLACRSLQYGECELALAGGVSVREPDRIGHLYQPGGMESPDGHVRTFDADARGSLFGDGVAVVVLKPLERALADRDTVLAVIRGSAINNDGALKFGYTAPSVVGQAEAVAAALADAGVDAAEVSYVEAHGTATELGDPMEVAALKRAFGATEQRQYCGIGSVKTNVGHLDRAAGTTGLIKVVQALRHQAIPRTLHFRKPNPEIDFEDSPFYVVAEHSAWPRTSGRPRIAGVNSLGMGGTNAHVLIEEAPRSAEPARARTGRRYQILPVSARSTAAADAYCEALHRHLTAYADLDLADVAYTLQAGRRVFEHRRVTVSDSVATAATALRSEDRPVAGVPPMFRRVDATRRRPVGFLFAGVGEQYRGMVARRYAEEPVFRAALDECRDLLGASIDADLVTLLTEPDEGSTAGAGDLARLLGRTGSTAPADDPLLRTEVAQPAVFAAGYATAKMLLAWGLEPRVMVGYSVGEYVAACLAGVLSLPDALRLVAHRAALIAGLPTGGMLAVSWTPDELSSRAATLDDAGIDVAVTTGSQVVLAGPGDAIEQLAQELRDQEVPCRELDTTHAFHSRMLAPVADELTRWIAENVTLGAPQRPYLSNVTGGLATRELVTDPGYWARHMCQQVRFGDGLAAALIDPDLAFVEVGPGRSLGALLRAHPDCDRDRWPLIVSTIPAAADAQGDDALLATELAKLWLTGVEINWSAYHGATAGGSAEAPRPGPGRIPLPTYPFQHQDYWLDARPGGRHGPEAPAIDDPVSAAAALPRLPEDHWLSIPVWQQTAPRPEERPVPANWLVYLPEGDSASLGEGLIAKIGRTGASVTVVRPGDRYEALDDGYRIRPGDVRDTASMLAAMKGIGRVPDRVVHLWTLAVPGSEGIAGTDEIVQAGIHSLVALAQAAGELGMDSWALDIVTADSQQVLGTTAVVPARATVLGAALLVPVEFPGVHARLIDIDTAEPESELLIREILAVPSDRVVSLRAGHRWILAYDPLPAASAETTGPDDAGDPFRPGGVYLITGGLGGVALGLAERLATEYQARLVLFGRTPVPPRDQWDAILARPGTSDEVRRRLTGLRTLEAKGAEVVVVAGDVADVTDLRRAVDLAHERFGGLDGVLHAAGVPGIGMIQFKTTADVDRVLRPKIAGTIALTEALRDKPVEFVILFSSITSATGGGAGQLDYCAANAFLDAYAQADPLPGTRVIAINWGEWIWNGWREGLEGYDPVMREFFEENRRRLGISFDEGWRALGRILRDGHPQVVVTTQDFPAMVELSRHYTVEDVHAASQNMRAGGDRHPRPDLATPFLAPQTDDERTIAGLWAAALGLAEVGTEDNFFELGGNSLIGVDIVARIRRALRLDQLPPHILYEAPTVGALAKAARGGPAARGEDNSARGLARQRRLEMRRASLGRGGAS